MGNSFTRGTSGIVNMSSLTGLQMEREISGYKHSVPNGTRVWLRPVAFIRVCTNCLPLLFPRNNGLHKKIATSLIRIRWLIRSPVRDDMFLEWCAPTYSPKVPPETKWEILSPGNDLSPPLTRKKKTVGAVNSVFYILL